MPRLWSVSGVRGTPCASATPAVLNSTPMHATTTTVRKCPVCTAHLLHSNERSVNRSQGHIVEVDPAPPIMNLATWVRAFPVRVVHLQAEVARIRWEVYVGRKQRPLFGQGRNEQKRPEARQNLEFSP